MRKFSATLLFILMGSSTGVFALTPRPDQTPQFFAGEWVGVGPMNQFCRMELKLDGGGALQMRGASGAWTRQVLKWRNVGQSVVIDQPKTFVSENQMNGTFKLILGSSSDSFCQMQRKSEFDRHLKEAQTPP